MNRSNSNGVPRISHTYAVINVLAMRLWIRPRHVSNVPMNMPIKTDARTMPKVYGNRASRMGKALKNADRLKYVFIIQSSPR